MSNVRRDVDWQAIKNAYRCAAPGIRMLAEIHGVSEGTIRARARREGWTRDLAAAIRGSVKKRLALSPRAAAAVLSRRPMVALQREDIAECTALWRSWGEQRAYRDIDGNVRLIGWNAPKRDRPRCGAKTRAGGSCNAPAVPGKERCRMHGGLSTGPRTKAGKRRSLAAAQAGFQRWNEARRSR